MSKNHTKTETDLRQTGLLAYKTVAMPADMNSINTLFGGAMLSYLDLAGAVVANQAAGERAVLVGVEKTSFKAPVFVGQSIDIYGKVHAVGRTSITIHLQAWRHDRLTDEQTLSAESQMTYVYVNNDQKPIRVRLKDSISFIETN